MALASTQFRVRPPPDLPSLRRTACSIAGVGILRERGIHTTWKYLTPPRPLPLLPFVTVRLFSFSTKGGSTTKWRGPCSTGSPAAGGGFAAPPRLRPASSTGTSRPKISAGSSSSPPSPRTASSPSPVASRLRPRTLAAAAVPLAATMSGRRSRRERRRDGRLRWMAMVAEKKTTQRRRQRLER